MDCRLTLSANETFLELLNASYQSGEKAYLLIDDNGITRTEGIIEKISVDTSVPFLELETGIKVNLGKIVAVNGVFRPEYGEC